MKSNKDGIHIHKSPSFYASNKYDRHKTFISRNGGWQNGIHEWKIKCLVKKGESAIGICCVHPFKFNDKNIEKAQKFDWDKSLNIAAAEYIATNKLEYVHYWYSSGSTLGTTTAIYAYCKGGVHPKCGYQHVNAKYVENDIVTVRLDCNNWKLHWLLNKYDDKNEMYQEKDKLISNYHDIIPYLYYYPIICSTGTFDEGGDSFQILFR